MKKKIIVIVSIILSVAIVALTLGLTLSKCSGKKIVQVVMVDQDKDKDDDDSSTNDTDNSDDDDTDDSTGNGFLDEPIGTDLGFKDGEMENLSDLFDVKNEVYTLKSKNGSEPLCKTFRGLTGTVYWPTEFTDDVFGRHYTEDMMKEELRRLVDAGITHVRTQIQTSWVFSGNEDKPWDWECERMQEMYAYFRTMKEVGLTPIVVLFGSMAGIVYGGNNSAQADSYYLTPRILDENGRPIVIEKWLVYFEIPDYEETYKRLAQYTVELYNACKDHDAEINDVMFFTEPHEDGGSPTGAHGEMFVECFTTIHERLIKEGIRDKIKVYGPNQSSKRGGLARLIMEQAPDTVDVYTSHFTPNGQVSTDDLYDTGLEVYRNYMQVMTDFESEKEFWIDEFGLDGDIYVPQFDMSDAFRGTQQAGYMTAMMNAGISGFSAWQFLQKLWPDYIGSGGEFWYGVQLGGDMQSLFTNEAPFPSYYASTLYSKYSGRQNGKTYYSYAEDEMSGLYIGTVELEDGGWSIYVVNMTTDEKSFQIDFERSLCGKTLYRYLYSPETVNPTVKAEIIKADKGFKNVDKTLCDTLSGGSVAVYSTIENF